jgi:hypothetical protein
LALSQIQGIIAREPTLHDGTTPDESGDEMWEEYRVALDACSITFNILSDRLSNLEMDDMDEYNATTAKSRIKAVMNGLSRAEYSRPSSCSGSFVTGFPSVSLRTPNLKHES